MNRSVASLVIVYGLCLSSFAQSEYEIDGTLIQLSYNPQNSGLRAATSNRFELFARDKQWRINLYGASPTNGDRLLTVVGSVTGEEIVDRMADGAPIVQVVSQQYPNGAAAPHLWFMYLSGRLLAEHKGPTLPPVYRYAYIAYGGEHRNRRAFLDQPAVTTLSDGLPKLPKRVAYFNDGWTGLSENAWHRNPPPYDQGYTNAIYEASEYERVGDVTLPRLVKFTEFGPDIHGVTSNSLCVVSTFEARVHVIRGRCSPQSVTIDLPPRFFGFDSRLQKGTNTVVTHYTQRTFSNLPTIGQLEKIAARPPTRVPKRHRTGLATTLLALTLGSPAVVIAGWWYLTRKH